MTDRATKADLLGGRAARPFEVPALEGKEVLIQPLSVAEAQEVEACELAGIRVTGEQARSAAEDRKVGKAAPRGFTNPQPTFELDVVEVVKGASESNVLATAYGLVDPELSVDEVRRELHPDVVTQIGEEVKRRSGIGDDAQARIQQFRELAGGPGDASPAPVGSISGT